MNITILFHVYRARTVSLGLYRFKKTSFLPSGFTIQTVRLEIFYRIQMSECYASLAPLCFPPFSISTYSQGDRPSNISHTDFTQCFSQGKSWMCLKYSFFLFFWAVIHQKWYSPTFTYVAISCSISFPCEAGRSDQEVKGRERSARKIYLLINSPLAVLAIYVSTGGDLNISGNFLTACYRKAHVSVWRKELKIGEHPNGGQDPSSPPAHFMSLNLLS